MHYSTAVDVWPCDLQTIIHTSASLHNETVQTYSSVSQPFVPANYEYNWPFRVQAGQACTIAQRWMCGRAAASWPSC